MPYKAWAGALVRHFFGAHNAQSQVRLLVTRNLLDETFPELGGAEGYVAALRRGPEWLTSQSSLLQIGLILEEQWRHKDLRPKGYPAELVALHDAPPFLPYLCLLCLAWTEGGESMPPTAYFSRLSLLHPESDVDYKLGKWECLWNGLSDWTRSLEGVWGFFYLERLGGWAHIGIPRAQVIFTPGRIDRLPELFIECGIEPHSKVIVGRLRELIILHPQAADRVLGPMVTREILNGTDLGKSAVQIVFEYFQDWNGERRSRSPGAETTRAILLTLKLIDDSRWHGEFVVAADAGSDGIIFPNEQWTTVPATQQLALIIDSRGVPVDAFSDTRFLGDGFTLVGVERGPETERPVTFVTLNRDIRLFEHWVNGDRLVESRSLPSAGVVYILVSPAAAERWEGVKEHLPASVTVDDCSWGFPAGWHLYCFDGLEHLTQENRRELPGFTATFHGRAKYISLVQGTRYNSSTARRVYADYDPPLLITQGPVDAYLDVTGAAAEELTPTTSSHNLPGRVLRTFLLRISDEESVVTATLALNGVNLASLSFGVYRDTATAAVRTATTLTLDSLGNPTSDPGVCGMRISTERSAYGLAEGSFDIGEQFDSHVLTSQAFKLLESVYLNGRRLTFGEFRRRALEIAAVEPWRVNGELAHLAHLGFVDLLSDSRGCWSHVYPAPLQLYLLPCKARGRFQATLSGTGSIAIWTELTRLAASLDCDIRVVQHQCRSIPPRITFLHEDAEVFPLLCDELHLTWITVPPALSIAEWADGLDAWMASVIWFPDSGPEPSAEYCPDVFQFVPNERFAAPFHLRRFSDPFTGSCQWHALYHLKRDETWNLSAQHAFVRDSTWAAWKVHVSIAGEDDLVPIAYDPAKSCLIVPRQLRFPYLLSRALAASSGLPPESLDRTSVYSRHDLGLLSEDAKPYQGACAGYPLVPREVAALIATKVSARLVDVALT